MTLGSKKGATDESPRSAASRRRNHEQARAQETAGTSTAQVDQQGRGGNQAETQAAEPATDQQPNRSFGKTAVLHTNTAAACKLRKERLEGKDTLAIERGVPGTKRQVGPLCQTHAWIRDPLRAAGLDTGPLDAVLDQVQTVDVRALQQSHGNIFNYVDDPTNTSAGRTNLRRFFAGERRDKILAPGLPLLIRKHRIRAQRLLRGHSPTEAMINSVLNAKMDILTTAGLAVEQLYNTNEREAREAQINELEGRIGNSSSSTADARQQAIERLNRYTTAKDWLQRAGLYSGNLQQDLTRAQQSIDNEKHDLNESSRRERVMSDILKSSGASELFGYMFQNYRNKINQNENRLAGEIQPKQRFLDEISSVVRGDERLSETEDVVQRVSRRFENSPELQAADTWLDLLINLSLGDTVMPFPHHHNIRTQERLFARALDKLGGTAMLGTISRSQSGFVGHARFLNGLYHKEGKPVVSYRDSNDPPNTIRKEPFETFATQFDPNRPKPSAKNTLLTLLGLDEPKRLTVLSNIKLNDETVSKLTRS